MIRKRGDQWVLYTKDGKRVLGRHDTKADAEKQERTIQRVKWVRRERGK